MQTIDSDKLVSKLNSFTSEQAAKVLNLDIDTLLWVKNFIIDEADTQSKQYVIDIIKTNPLVRHITLIDGDIYLEHDIRAAPDFHHVDKSLWIKYHKNFHRDGVGITVLAFRKKKVLTTS